MRTDTNERAEVRELRGVAAEDLRGALLEMEAVASGSRTTKPFYHASINTRADERLTEEQRTHAIDRLEEKLGLSGQPRVVVVHEKEGREHCHIVWSRIDLDRMRAISDSHNYRKHEEVARDLEREFGHERVQGAHAERDGKDRPDRTPSHEEMLQADRGAVSPDEAKALVTELWRRTDSGQSFRAALEERDWILARGDRRDFVVVDPHGGTHSLARRVEAAKAKDIRARMADVDPELLPSVTEARTERRERQAHQPVASPEVSSPAPSQNPEPPNYRSHATVQMGHAIAERDAERQAAHDLLEQAARADNRTLRNRPAAPSAERAFADAAREQAQVVRNERREEKFQAQQETWRSSVNERNPDKAKPVDKGLQVVDSATGFVMGLGEFMLDFLSGSSPQRQPDPNDPATRSRQQVDRLLASRRADGAIENIQRDIEAGRHLKSEDIKSLTREHQEQIKSHGDNYVRQMVDEARQRDERHWRNDGRERER
jgi:hypothetical protein